MLDAYQPPTATMTLREGLAEYFKANPGLTEVAPDDPSAELFLPHDACHVVFGLGTSLVEEAMADTWTMVGADIRVGAYLKMLKYIAALEPGSIVKKLGLWAIVRDSVLGTGAVVRAAWRARAMTKPWPFRGYVDYLDTPLDEIRAEFGIVVYQPPAWLRRASSVRPEPTAALPGGVNP